MAEFKDSPTSLVADVDCTADGQPLCEKYGVQGYPTIKYGEPEDMKDYQGGRSFADLKKFAEENLGPTCGPGENLRLCDAATRTKIEGYLAMSEAKLEEKVQKIVNNYEVEISVMKKVVGYLKAKER
eukprot:SRR837773.25022.p2 GENE.SRR837773.25022~~SRR837773.25022.p2  ORF type:complete len:127 (-),score=74.85 SRR837773.25022:81-461(-)